MKKGFTLIELLVVIAIIGILATITVIGYNSATTSAKKKAVSASMTNVLKAAAVCTADGSAALVDPPAAGGLICSSTSVTDARWPDWGINNSDAQKAKNYNGYYITTINFPSVAAGALTGSFTATGPSGSTVTCNVTTSVCTAN